MKLEFPWKLILHDICQLSTCVDQLRLLKNFAQRAFNYFTSRVLTSHNTRLRPNKNDDDARSRFPEKRPYRRFFWQEHSNVQPFSGEQCAFLVEKSIPALGLAPLIIWSRMSLFKQAIRKHADDDRRGGINTRVRAYSSGVYVSLILQFENCRARARCPFYIYFSRENPRRGLFVLAPGKNAGEKILVSAACDATLLRL